MTRIVPFQRWHFDLLADQGEAVSGGLRFDAPTLAVLEKQNSWTAVVDVDPVACGGTVQHWPGRSLAWIYLNPQSGRHMTFVTRAARETLANVPGRIEITVRSDFEKGHRWARMLGFEVETPRMKGYGPHGEDHVGYVRFN